MKEFFILSYINMKESIALLNYLNESSLIPEGRQRPNRAFLILGRLPKLDSRPDSCEILHNRVLSRVLANKTIFIKNT